MARAIILQCANDGVSSANTFSVNTEALSEYSRLELDSNNFNIETIDIVLSAGEIYTIPEGYHNGWV